MSREFFPSVKKGILNRGFKKTTPLLPKVLPQKNCWLTKRRATFKIWHFPLKKFNFYQDFYESLIRAFNSSTFQVFLRMEKIIICLCFYCHKWSRNCVNVGIWEKLTFLRLAVEKYVIFCEEEEESKRIDISFSHAALKTNSLPKKQRSLNTPWQFAKIKQLRPSKNIRHFFFVHKGKEKGAESLFVLPFCQKKEKFIAGLEKGDHFMSSWKPQHGRRGRHRGQSEVVRHAEGGLGDVQQGRGQRAGFPRHLMPDARKRRILLIAGEKVARRDGQGVEDVRRERGGHGQEGQQRLRGVQQHAQEDVQWCQSKDVGRKKRIFSRSEKYAVQRQVQG